jgi:hypothetical protein
VVKAVAEVVKVVAEEDTVVTEADKVVAEVDMVVTEADEGVADEDHREAVASSYRHSTYITILFECTIEAICLSEPTAVPVSPTI